MNWVDGIDGLPICWLSGPAGSGKSAIAQSIAEKCKFENKLAASFFFSRGDSLRDNTDRFFLTLANQLTILVPSTKRLILDALINNSLIPTANLETQFKSLIQGPVLALERPVYQMVVIVDSLDECVDKDGILKVIGIITGAIRKKQLPLYFFFTSRPERHIEAEFRDLTTDNPESLARRLSLEEYKADADIRIFLQEEFGNIRRKRRDFIPQGPEPWPPTADLECLVKRSEGSFQWASTVVKVVGGGKDTHSKQLQSALKMHAGLDPLYRQVVSSARSKDFERVIGTIIVLRYRLPVKQLGLLINFETSDIRAALEGLESVCKIPQDDEEEIQPFHASLYDFFADSERSKEFFVDPVAHHSSVLLDCLRIIKGDLKDDEIDRAVARYVCGSWCHHLNRVLMHGGEDDLLYSQGIGFLMECLRDMAYGTFKPWFKAVLLERGDIFRSRRDLGSTMARLRVSCLSFQYRIFDNPSLL